jgi:ribosomal protein S18 acetylase RimI-like enzyme
MPHLMALDFEFISDRALGVEKESDGLAVTWRLRPQKLDPPFCSTDSSPTAREWRGLEQNLAAGLREGFVVETAGRPVAFIELEAQRWRSVGFIWELLIHRPYRRQGIGAALVEAAVEWGRRQSLRALALETQTNNWPALNFYQKVGFDLCAIDDHFYTNRDREAGEVALFWYYELEGRDVR